jgi:hypothetical protein
MVLESVLYHSAEHPHSLRRSQLVSVQPHNDLEKIDLQPPWEIPMPAYG